MKTVSLDSAHPARALAYRRTRSGRPTELTLPHPIPPVRHGHLHEKTFRLIRHDLLAHLLTDTLGVGGRSNGAIRRIYFLPPAVSACMETVPLDLSQPARAVAYRRTRSDPSSERNSSHPIPPVRRFRPREKCSARLGTACLRGCRQTHPKRPT